MSPDGQIWIQGLALGRLSEHWRSHLEVQPRWFDDASELGLTIVRSAVGRQLSPRITVWGGHAWVPKTFGPGVRHEQRLWEQVSISLPPLGTWRPAARVRVEQRWQPEPWDDSSHRVRMMMRLQRPLGPNSRWQIAAYDEVMFTMDETTRGPLRGFDRNRLYGGIVRTIHPRVSVEAGYLWERSRITRLANLDSHVASATVTAQWPRF